jgi:histidinol dehydrogenase
MGEGMSLVVTLHHESADFSVNLDAIRARLHGGNLVAGGPSSIDVPAVVSDILNQVRTFGDVAAARLTNTFDHANVTPDTLRVPAETLARAADEADPEFIALMRAAIANIREYQEHIRHRSPPDLIRGGRALGVRYTPLDRVAVYVPGGQALYPSTVLMTVVPAQVAGVREIAMFSPPRGGELSPMALALAYELGVTEVYRLGGAVAVAAAGFGTQSIAPVAKIVGPGNAFVAEAKRQLFGRVGIDSIAGPSEVLIIADDSANPAWVAADMLAQAEHNPGSSLLVTDSVSLAKAVTLELERQLQTLERADITRPSLQEYSAIVVVKDLAQCCDIANTFATEHLQLMTRDDETCLTRIRHAGAIFVGYHTPVPLGDYFAGPSHVLPTGGTAKFFGPLSCNDFLKASSTLRYDATSVALDAPHVDAFARREGLTAHARAATIRAVESS